MALAQGWLLRHELDGIEGRKTFDVIVRLLGAALIQAGVSYGVWRAVDGVVGRHLWAQCVSVGLGIATGLAVYSALVWILRVPEARQIRGLLAGRLGRRGSAPS
jgi:hypothetical protein